MSIEVRLMQRDEAELANGFFNSIYKSNRSMGDFEWEFFNGPGGAAIYVIAIDSTHTASLKIVGIQCAIPLNLTDVSGNIIRSAKSEDTLVDPAYRGQKIFERMYDLLFVECKRAGIKYIWGFTPAKKAFERIGFEIPFQAHQALMVFKPSDAFNHLVSLNPSNKFSDKLKIGGLTLWSWMTGAKRLSKLALNISHNPATLESKNTVLSALQSRSTYFFPEMTSTYLDWRFTKNPFGNKYENYHFFSGKRLVADVIINFRSSLGYIEQIIFDESIDRKTRQDVIGSILRMMRPKVSFVRLLCFDINNELALQEDDLKQCGFTVLKRGAHFVWKALDGQQVDPKNILLTRLFTQGNQ